MKFLKSKWLWIVLVLIVVGVVWWQKSQDVVIAPENIVTVSQSDIVQSITVSGSLEPQRYANLSFSAAQLGMGEITEIFTSVGDLVMRDEVLVHIDNSAARTQAYGAWQTAHAQEELEKLARRKWGDLKPEERARWKQLSSAARASASASLITAQKSTLVAPIDGVVAQQNAIIGQSPSTGTVVRIIDLQSLQIEALVSESDILDIAPMMTGRAAFDALPAGEEYSVTIDRINPEATVIADVVYYTVYFNITNTTETITAMNKLRAGMSVDIDIILREKNNVVTIPRRLVSTDADGEFVMVLASGDTTQTTERRTVVTGLDSDDGTIEIISGLRTGEQIVSGE